ncbi:unnamed protein product, partial [Sphacelaria rigidula]
KFQEALSSPIAEEPANEHLVLMMMDAHARTGKREGGGMGDVRVLAEYGRDTQDDNVGCLLKCAAKHQITITNTFFRTPTPGRARPHICMRLVEHRWRLDNTLSRQQERRPVRNVDTVHPEIRSDHRLVSATTCLLGRNGPNRQPK